MSFANKIVLITGSGRGMGAAVAHAFAKESATVCVADLDEMRAKSVASDITRHGGIARAFHTDVRDDASVKAMFQNVDQEFKGLDILVNMAGGYGEAFRRSDETPADEWDMVIDSNLKGSFLCAKYAVPLMRKRHGGRIINFSSNAGRTVSPLLGCSYTAAKAGVIGLSRHLAKEYANEAILVNTVAPGPVDGDRLADLLDHDGKDSLAAQIPIGRLASSDDIAPVVLFLASDAASFMTGAILDVNGGYVLA
jgi:3-oxoacyl-[acyl-carrier protein] reductase